MKKTLSLLLVAVMLIMAIPLSVSATETSYVTFEAAYEVGRTGSSATIDLHFSEPVRFVLTDKDIAKLCNRPLTSPGTSNPGDWQHYSHNNDDSIYLNPQTGEDGNTYSDVIRLTFSKGSDATPSIYTENSIIPLSGAAGIRILESYKNTATAYDDVLDTASIVGISGNPIRATQTHDSKNELAWVDLTRAITLDDVQFDGWNATLTFSAPVTFTGLSNAIRCSRDYLASQNPQYQPQSATYLGEVTVVDGVSYSKTVRVAFKNASGYIAGATHGFTPAYSDLGVRLIEFNNGDGDNGMISTKNIVGLHGLPVAGTHKSGSVNIAWKQASAIRSLTEFVSAEVTDPASGVVTMTFSEPIHISDAAGGFRLTWDYNPDASAAGHYQFQPDADAQIVYVNGQELNGQMYSDTIQMKFALGSYDSIPAGAGIRIVEYNKTADLGNCSVSPTVAVDAEGLPIAANKQAGTVDIAWQTITFSGATTTLLGAQMIAQDTVLVDFSRPVSVVDLTGITAAGVAATSAVSESGAESDDQWKITFAEAPDTANGATITFTASSVQDIYGCDLLTPAEALLDPWQDETIDYGDDFSGEFTAGAAYHFMNTDTGRGLAVGTVDEWVLEKIDGVNMYVLKDGETGRYLDLTGTAPVLSDYPCRILLRKGANERYQVVVGGKMVLADSDDGEDAAITLTRLADGSQDISTGWYLTESGGTRPLRVMPLGDSITYGVNPDLASSELRVGYRATLSQELTSYLGRVVFVGSEVTASTTLSETRLLRHAGFPGYVVTDIWNEAGHPGVNDLIDGLCAKYAPDVVLMMLGTNDLTRMVKAGTTTGGDLADQITRYTAFIQKIGTAMNERGAILCSSLTPRGDSVESVTMQPLVDSYNLLLEDMVYDLAESGTKIVYNDNASAVGALGTAGLSSDKLHLSTAGSQALAAQYLSTFKKVYTAQSTKKSYTVSVDLCDGAQLTLLSGSLTGIMPGGTVSFRVSARTGFEGALAITVDGESADSTVVTLRGITEDHAVSVTGLTAVVGVADLQELLNSAQSGSTVALEENYDTRSYYDVIVVPAGITLDLNGQYVYAKNILAFGDVVDSTEGTGLLAISKADTDAFVCLQSDNADLPIYDAEKKGYRFFSCEMISHDPQSTDGTFVKFGVTLKFKNMLAYELLKGDPDLALRMQLTVGQSSLTYNFTPSILSAYANAVLADPTRIDHKVVVLKVSNLGGLASGTVLTATPTLTSATKGQSCAAIQSYTMA